MGNIQAAKKSLIKKHKKRPPKPAARKKKEEKEKSYCHLLQFNCIKLIAKYCYKIVNNCNNFVII